VHGGLDGGPQAFSRPNETFAGRIGVLLHASSCFRKINRDKNFVVPGVSQPLARSLDPEDSVDLYRGISGAGLHKQRIAPQPRR
jgi:hypothetical protein